MTFPSIDILLTITFNSQIQNKYPRSFDMELNEINPYVLKVMPSAMRKFDHEISVDPKIIKLTLGEPNFNVPDHIKQAAIDAINDNKSHYPYYWGYQELRDAASKYYRDKFGYDYPADQIVVTVGATEAVAVPLKRYLSLVMPWLFQLRLYPLYDASTTLNELNTLLVDTSDDDFILTPAKVQKAIDDHPDLNVKGLILNDPNNPTGVAYSKEQIAALAPRLEEEWHLGYQ